MDEPKIVYEDENFVGVSKPAGMLTHPYKTNENRPRFAGSRGARQMANGEDTLAGWLLKKYPEMRNVGDDPETRPGIVHRLDRETSGIMLAVRNQKYFEYFKSLFKERQIKKTYLALVSGEPRKKQGVIDKPIGIKNGSVKRSVHSEKMLKSAVTEYKVVKTFLSNGVPFSLLEVSPKTGRTHQIRVHLASIGHPIVGDSLYGGKKNAGLAKRLMLHAYSLEFSLPTPACLPARAGAGRQAGLPNGSRLRIEAEPDELFSGFKP